MRFYFVMIQHAIGACPDATAEDLAHVRVDRDFALCASDDPAHRCHDRIPKRYEEVWSPHTTSGAVVALYDTPGKASATATMHERNGVTGRYSKSKVLATEVRFFDICDTLVLSGPREAPLPVQYEALMMRFGQKFDAALQVEREAPVVPEKPKRARKKRAVVAPPLTEVCAGCIASISGRCIDHCHAGDP